jgi:protoporphyrin/coproporphyrin ferrochelatase
MSFRPEPPYRHDRVPVTAVLLCNLGTPQAPTPQALRRYLAEFLSDPRVVEIPRLIWWPILHGIILRTRPAKSAAKYASIWTPQGSPLKVWTERQAQLLQDWLTQRGHQVTVQHAMRYGSPSMAATLDALKAQGAQRVLILPAYPQYSGATTASMADAVSRWSLHVRTLPELRYVQRYHDHPAYIDALAQGIESRWQTHGRGQKLVLSFHGMPQRTLQLGDPYHCECLKTARLLAQRLGLSEQDYVVTFQSRFGRAKWIEPYTEPTVVALAQAGIKHIDIACPGFVSDCIETLEEIDQEVRLAYTQAGGETMNYVACLNDSPSWIDALGQDGQVRQAAALARGAKA